MDGKTFRAFITDLEAHHGRQFNMKSFELLAPRISAIPTGAITDEARLYLKTAFGTIPTPLVVIMKLEDEAKKYRLKSEDERLAQYEAEKAQDVKRYQGEKGEEFGARSIALLLLMSSQAPQGKKLREYSRMCKDFPEAYILAEYDNQLAEAMASGTVAECGLTGEIMSAEECPLYVAAYKANQLLEYRDELAKRSGRL